MSGPEDTGSNTVEDAARFERWRSRNYGDDYGADALADRPLPARDRHGRLVPTRCTCNSRSESPCNWCSMTADEP